MKFSWCASYYHRFLHLLSPQPHVCAGVTTVSTETLASNSSLLKKYWSVNMVLDDTLGRRIYFFIDNILKSATKKEMKQKIDFSFFGVRHIGLIVTAVTINSFTPVFPCIILNQVAKFFIETQTHQWHVIFFICIIYKILQKSRENRTCTDVLSIEYPHDLISDWLNSSKTYMSDRPNRTSSYSVCRHICRMFSQFTRYVLSSASKHVCQNISCK